jgi:hypothetical protein
MRRLFMIGLATLFFSGCMMDVTVPMEQAPPDHQVEAAVLQADVLSEVPAYYGDYRPNPHVPDDRQLRKPGQVMSDSRGELEVLKATGEQKQLSAGPAELTVRDAKILRYEPDSSLAAHYRKFTHEPEFTLVKLFVEVRNTGEEPVRFDPVAEIVADTGETLLWEEEIYQEGLGGEIVPGELKAGNIGFILREEGADVLTIHAEGIEFEVGF